MELQLDVNKRYTYADYLTWIDEKRREIVNGIIKKMTPAPRRIHQEILGNLDYQFRLFLKDKKCKTYFAPFDVRLPNNEETENDKIHTVVQTPIVKVIVYKLTPVVTVNAQHPEGKPPHTTIKCLQRIPPRFPHHRL